MISKESYFELAIKGFKARNHIYSGHSHLLSDPEKKRTDL